MLFYKILLHIVRLNRFRRSGRIYRFDGKVLASCRKWNQSSQLNLRVTIQRLFSTSSWTQWPLYALARISIWSNHIQYLVLGCWSGMRFLNFHGCVIAFWEFLQMMVQRVLSAKSISHAQGATIMAGYIKLLPFFVMVMPGMISRALYTGKVLLFLLKNEYFSCMPKNLTCLPPQNPYFTCIF